MPQKSKYPFIRVSVLANKRADEIVQALQARGIEDASKTSVVSELILSMPIPQPVVEKKHSQKRGSAVTSTAAV